MSTIKTLAGVQHMACGGCGVRTHELGWSKDGHIVTECTGCHSLSIIKPKPAEIEVAWGPGDQLGRLTIWDV